MKKIELIRITEEYVKKCLVNKEPGHDYLHVERVRKISLKLAKTAQSDNFLVEMIALLHDIEDHKFDNNYHVKEFLDGIEIDNDYKERILYILPFISFSKYPTLPETFPIEGKIVQDADRLDAIGAIGIARAFSYGGNKNRRMYGTSDSTINHFDEKLLILDQYLYLDESKRIAKRRMRFLKNFYIEFIKETKWFNFKNIL